MNSSEMKRASDRSVYAAQTAPIAPLRAAEEPTLVSLSVRTIVYAHGTNARASNKGLSRGYSRRIFALLENLTGLHVSDECSTSLMKKKSIHNLSQTPNVVQER